MSVSKELTPMQIGYLLSAIGAKAEDSTYLNENAVLTLKDVDYPVERLVREARLLGAFAVEWVIFRTLSQSPNCEPIRRGFWDGWHEAAQKGVIASNFFDDYQTKAPIYSKAAAKLESQAPGILGNPISDQLAYFMTEDEDMEHGRETEISLAASLVGPVIFDTNQQVAFTVLVENGYVVRR